MLTCFGVEESRPFCSQSTALEAMASSQLSQAERFTEVSSDVKPTLTARGLFSGPERDDDPNLEMYEVAGRVVCD